MRGLTLDELTVQDVACKYCTISSFPSLFKFMLTQFLWHQRRWDIRSDMG